MRFPLILLAMSAAFGLTNCQPVNTRPQQVQPVVTQRPPAPKVTRSTSSSSSSRKSNSPSEDTFTKVEVKPEPEVAPLSKPDPLKTLQTPKKPAFDVPENIKPKVNDGIDQGVFIELKW